MTAAPLERRREPRRMPGEGETLATMRMRMGADLVVIDIAPGGALVEGGVRLLPGSRVDVHVVTRGGRVLVRARIVRAFVAAVRADAVRYRGALAFDQAIDVTPSGYSLPAGREQFRRDGGT